MVLFLSLAKAEAGSGFRCPLEVVNASGFRVVEVNITDFWSEGDFTTANIRAFIDLTVGDGALEARGNDIFFAFSLYPLDGDLVQETHTFRCPGVLGGCAGREIQHRMGGITDLVSFYNLQLPFCVPLAEP
jgi:hypothetical protein